MTRYTYKVIPAPAKGRKAQGVKGAEARFAYGLEEAINEMAAQGWEYLRADILPSEERQGLTSTATVYRSVLVFRREVRGTDAGDRPVPSLTARRGPAPEEPLKFTRKTPVVPVAADDEATVAEDLPAPDADTDTEDRAENDDAPVRPGEEPADTETAETETTETATETDAPKAGEEQEDPAEANNDDEDDAPRR